MAKEFDTFDDVLQDALRRMRETAQTESTYVKEYLGDPKYGVYVVRRVDKPK